MHINTESSRRYLIVGLLAVAACIGAIIRYFAPKNSDLHNIGSLLMIIWIPIVANILIYFAKKRRPIVLVSQGFSQGALFIPHALVEVTFNHSVSIKAGEVGCIFAVGTEGFSTRVLLPQEYAPEEAVQVQAQFLVPIAALEKISAISTFQLFQGATKIGKGRLLSAKLLA